MGRLDAAGDRTLPVPIATNRITAEDRTQQTQSCDRKQFCSFRVSLSLETQTPRHL
jgi:hypothetical protein